MKLPDLIQNSSPLPSEEGSPSGALAAGAPLARDGEAECPPGPARFDTGALYSVCSLLFT
eukprot:scaffold131137_cov31-Tisochrysis_lutea.AAC.5